MSEGLKFFAQSASSEAVSSAVGTLTNHEGMGITVFTGNVGVSYLFDPVAKAAQEFMDGLGEMQPPRRLATAEEIERIGAALVVNTATIPGATIYTMPISVGGSAPVGSSFA